MTTTTAGAATAAPTATPVAPVLTQITAAHHPGYDRLVFTFRGGVPSQHTVQYVSQVIADPSGLPVSVVGNAKLLVRFDARHRAQRPVGEVNLRSDVAYLRAAGNHPGGPGG